MANYLDSPGGAAVRASGGKLPFAGSTGRWVAELHQHCQITLDQYVIEFRRGEAAGQEWVVPRLGYLLHLPAFAPLAQWLQQRRPDLDELQAELDVILEVTRGRAFAKGNVVLIADA